LRRRVMRAPLGVVAPRGGVRAISPIGGLWAGMSDGERDAFVRHHNAGRAQKGQPWPRDRR
jgi:hypothetical protein